MEHSTGESRVVTATRLVAAPADILFELIADPARQPEWDGNHNLVSATTNERICRIGQVFGMGTTKGKVKDNHIVAFEEGRTIAWLTADAGQEAPGHIWRWDLTPASGGGTLVTHTYDWSGVWDESRWPRHRQTTSANLLASIDRLAAIAIVLRRSDGSVEP